MNPDVLFSLANLLVLPQWLLMLLGPRLRFTQWLMRTHVIPLVLAMVYLLHVVALFGVEGGGFGSLGAVKALFTSDRAVLAGWVHYLAFDLLTGVWMVRDAETRPIPKIVLAPCLVLTFMLGPVGWLLYRVVMYRYPSIQNV